MLFKCSNVEILIFLLQLNGAKARFRKKRWSFNSIVQKSRLLVIIESRAKTIVSTMTGAKMIVESNM